MAQFTKRFTIAHAVGQLVTGIIAVPADLVAGVMDASREASGEYFPNLKVWYAVFNAGKEEGLTKPEAKALADRARAASKGGRTKFSSAADVMSFVTKHTQWAKANPRGGVQMERAKVKHAATTKRRAAKKTADKNKDALEVSRRKSA